jgi:hypothetical protein
MDVELNLDTRNMVASLQESQRRLVDIGRETTQQMRIVRARFGEATASIDENADSVEQLQIKQRYLGQRLEQQRTLVDALTDTYERSRAATGETSAETQRLELRLARAREEQARTEQQIRNTNRRLQEQSDAADETGRNWSDVSEKLKKAGEKMSTFVSLPIAGFAALATEGTKELRKELALLETNAHGVGANVEAINDAYRELYGIRDDLGANTETISELLAADFGDSNLQQALEGVIGAGIKFKDTLNFEGIADGLQETLAIGEAAGSFLELLERMGVSIDDWNAGLKEATENGTQHQFVLQAMADLGLNDVYKKYLEINGAMVDNAKANYDVQKSMAELGATIEPVVTKLTGVLADLIGLFNRLPESMQDFVLGLGAIAFVSGPVLMGLSSVNSLLGVGGLAGLLGKVSPLLTGLASKILPLLGLAFTFLLTPIGLVALAVSAFAGLAYLVISNWDEVKFALNSIWGSMKSSFVAFVNTIIEGINWIIEGLNKLQVTVPNWVSNVPGFDGLGGQTWGVNISKIPTLHDGGIYHAPPGQMEGLALLADGEEVIAKGEASGQVVRHTGTIRVEGVNDRGQIMGVVDIIMDQLRREVRV